MIDFADGRSGPASMNSTGSQTLGRLTPYLLLACFLRMQVSCCCAEGHDHWPSAAKVVAGGCACEHEHGGECTAEAGGHGQAAHHNHGCGGEGGADSHSGCHLCVIAHLRYLTPAASPAVDLLQHEIRLIVVSDLFQSRSLEVGDSKIPQALASLFACGSLLRI